ncbi:MAG TPA: gas vesicle protein GvpH [Candidatus Limnocylindrales bacterium]|nr:gas vesicle protein GvpH [Candidatus Limnocylindrales bacterium]
METGKERHLNNGIGGGLGGILKGLGDLVEKLGDLEKQGEISKTGSINGPGEQLRGIYGFTVKVGLGDQGPRIEPFGNIRRDADSGRTEVQEVREPMVDVFEEEDHLLVLAELPGVGKDDIKVDVKDDVLTITAERGDKKYRKEVLLPCCVPKSKMQVTCNNGVLEIKCPK